MRFRKYGGMAALALGAVMTLAACGGTTTTATQGNSGSQGSSSSSKPQNGSTLTIALSTDPVSLDPALEADWNSRQAIAYMYNTLIRVSKTGGFEGVLATSWKPSDNGMKYTFQLRKGVKFQDGTPFNAKAVVYNFDRMLNPKFNSKAYATLEPYIKSVVAEGPDTVVFNLKKPWANFLAEMTWDSLMVSPTAAKKEGADFYKHPVGTGPFEFSSYTPGSSLILKKNPNYWDGPVHLSEVKEEIIPNVNTEIIDLEAKKIDIAYAIPPRDVSLLKSKGIPVEVRTTPSTSMIMMNLAKGPTTNLLVRKAIARAINTKAMIQKVLYGYAEISQAGVPKESPYYNADVPGVQYNPKEAEKLLTRAGWKVGKGGVRYKDGKPLDIKILATTQDDWSEISQIMQQELDQVGFHATITSQAWGTFLNSMRSGDYGIAYWYLGGFTNQSDDGIENMNSKAYWNVSQITKQPQLKSEMNEIDSIYNTEVLQPNTTKRRADLKKFQELIYNHQILAWLWHEKTLIAIRPEVQNYRLVNFDFVFLTHAWLKQ